MIRPLVEVSLDVAHMEEVDPELMVVLGKRTLKSVIQKNMHKLVGGLKGAATRLARAAGHVPQSSASVPAGNAPTMLSLQQLPGPGRGAVGAMENKTIGTVGLRKIPWRRCTKC